MWRPPLASAHETHTTRDRTAAGCRAISPVFRSVAPAPLADASATGASTPSGNRDSCDRGEWSAIRAALVRLADPNTPNATPAESHLPAPACPPARTIRLQNVHSLPRY